MLESAGQDFLYYNGEVSLGRRTKALEDFKTDPRKNIMLVGLRAGSEGLNLTVANRVILIDPWWNKTTEQQAFGRVERIGQQKISHMVRILTTADIDQRIAQLQVKKSIKVDYALQDDGHIPVGLDDERLEKIFAPIAKKKGKNRGKREVENVEMKDVNSGAKKGEKKGENNGIRKSAVGGGATKGGMKNAMKSTTKGAKK